MDRVLRACALAWAVIAASLPCAFSAIPEAVVLTVPAVANPYLAGMPKGSKSTWGDKAPANSPVLIELRGGNVSAVSFRARGGIDHIPVCPPQCYSPDGSFLTDHEGGSEHGISGISAPMNSLLGVFLDDDRPDKKKAPKALDFWKIGYNFAELSPQLKQLFFIGTGINGKGAARRFLVPKGATRLYLGVMDRFEWNNNSGAFAVAVILERSEVSSEMYSTDSTVSFAKWPCALGRSRCTPEREIVEPAGSGRYLIVLPAHLPWSASIPTPAGTTVRIERAEGTVCLHAPPGGTAICAGPQGIGSRSGAAWLAPEKGPGALIMKTSEDRTSFSVNHRVDLPFRDDEGYFELEVTVR